METMNRMLWEAWYREEDTDEEIRLLEIALGCPAPSWVWQDRARDFQEKAQQAWFDAAIANRNAAESEQE